MKVSWRGGRAGGWHLRPSIGCKIAGKEIGFARDTIVSTLDVDVRIVLGPCGTGSYGGQLSERWRDLSPYFGVEVEFVHVVEPFGSIKAAEENKFVIVYHAHVSESSGGDRSHHLCVWMITKVNWIIVNGGGGGGMIVIMASCICVCVRVYIPPILIFQRVCICICACIIPAYICICICVCISIICVRIFLYASPSFGINVKHPEVIEPCIAIVSSKEIDTTGITNDHTIVLATSRLFDAQYLHFLPLVFFKFKGIKVVQSTCSSTISTKHVQSITNHDTCSTTPGWRLNSPNRIHNRPCERLFRQIIG
mmetsp:Transcript_4574/g.6481  ORF Transcript_4574/g.6481 Transcript_4574/m.6481 type:complete len:309 (+) Transcript_4574:559-1485(+)